MAEVIEKDFEQQIDALAQIDETKREIQQILLMRAANLPAGIAEYRKNNASKKQQLKSDLKKSNAFV